MMKKAMEMRTRAIKETKMMERSETKEDEDDGQGDGDHGEGGRTRLLRRRGLRWRRGQG